MSLELVAAVYLKAVKCPKCDAPIERTEDYRTDIVEINQIGGPPTLFLRGEEATLVCNSCN